MKSESAEYTLEKKKEDLKRVVDIATSDGNWNYDPYLQGMANGLILAHAIINDTEPNYLNPPRVWIRDIKKSEESPTVQ